MHDIKWGSLRVGMGAYKMKDWVGAKGLVCKLLQGLSGADV